MGMFEYVMEDHVAVLTMTHGENRFSFDFLDAFSQVLDEIENTTDARVLVVKSAHEKIWSNGIDLDWLMPLVQNDREAAKRFPVVLNALNKKILMYPMITVAAITGHAFAGGAIMAAAFDFRFMRSDRGFYCIPEVDIGIPLFPSMTALMKKAVPLPKFLEMQYTGKRLTAEECEAHQVVMKACHIDNLMDEVMTFARAQVKERKMIRIMKAVTYKDILLTFEQDDPVYAAAGNTGLD